MAVGAEEPYLDIFLRCCENGGVSRDAEIAEECGFSEEFEVCEAVVVLSYYCAGLEFVDCGCREEWLEE